MTAKVVQARREEAGLPEITQEEVLLLGRSCGMLIHLFGARTIREQPRPALNWEFIAVVCADRQILRLAGWVDRTMDRLETKQQVDQALGAAEAELRRLTRKQRSRKVRMPRLRVTEGAVL